MMNTQVTSNAKSFAFVPRHYTVDDAVAIIDETLTKNGITGISGERLYERHVNVQALAQRIVSNDDFDMGEFVTLVNSRFGVERLNQTLAGDLSTIDLITAIHHLAEQRA
jgi:hypothetical protein